jgi:adenylate kinase family enzyme
VRRIVILGRGGAGKSTLAEGLGSALALPVIELDKHFWASDLSPTPTDRWAEIQRALVSGSGWVIDGDLGPYDVLSVRLRAADTVVVLDFPLWRCAWRALRRSRERLDFWRWLITYRRRGLPAVLSAIAEHAPHAELHILRSPQSVIQFLTEAAEERTTKTKHRRIGGRGDR